jgi:glycosyltransferase involved in cell wall biosynthesis
MLLSVCIPTRNDPQSIIDILGVLVKSKCSVFEVIVVDDSTNLDTRHIIDEYRGKLDIRYFVGSGNGLDQALLDLIRESKGEYIWWLGNDVPLRKSVELITCYLEKFDGNDRLGFLWINSRSADDDELKTFQINRSFVTSNPNDLLDYDIGLLGFISATIFRKDLVLVHLNEAAKYVGSAWVCLYLMFHVVTSGSRLAMLSEVCFESPAKPAGERRWYDSIQVFGLNLYDIASEFAGEFDVRTLKRALDTNLRRVLRAVIYERAAGLETGFASPTFRSIAFLQKYYRYPTMWLYLPLLLVPRVFLRVGFIVRERLK